MVKHEESAMLHYSPLKNVSGGLAMVHNNGLEVGGFAVDAVDIT